MTAGDPPDTNDPSDDDDAAAGEVSHSANGGDNDGDQSAEEGARHLTAVVASSPENVVRVDFKAHANRVPADPTAPQKFAVFSRFIEKGKVMVTLDARRPGVSVPTRFADEAQLNLDFSVRFGLPDFNFDEKGVRASLSFNRQPFFCDLPWSAVYALFSHVDNDRLTWPRSLPAEILEQLPDASIDQLERLLTEQQEKLLRATREQHARDAQKATAEAEKRDKSGSGDDGGDDDEKPPPPSRGGLRLVKS